MAETNDTYEVGFRKPPKHSQFVKGRSGNPKGRPKGSKNLATILEKIGRERVTVTENGRSRKITKKEAIVLQLTNKSVSGDLKAIDHHLRLSQLYETSEQSTVPVSHDGDKAVMASILKRIRQSEGSTSEEQNNSERPDPKEED